MIMVMTSLLGKKIFDFSAVHCGCPFSYVFCPRLPNDSWLVAHFDPSLTLLMPWRGLGCVWIMFEHVEVYCNGWTSPKISFDLHWSFWSHASSPDPFLVWPGDGCTMSCRKWNSLWRMLFGVFDVSFMLYCATLSPLITPCCMSFLRSQSTCSFWDHG